MKNVKPMLGQTWSNNGNEYKVKQLGDGLANMWSSSIRTKLGIKIDDGFYSVFTFIPQTDLEWLAIYCNFSVMEVREYARRDKEFDFVIEYWHYRKERSHSHDEIQNKRYELGLDERTPKEAYREFDKQLKLDKEKEFEEEIRNCPVRGPLLKKIDETLSRSRKELVDYFLENKKPKRSIYLGPIPINVFVAPNVVIKPQPWVNMINPATVSDHNSQSIFVKAACAMSPGDALVIKDYSDATAAIKGFSKAVKLAETFLANKKATKVKEETTSLINAKRGEQFVLNNDEVVTFFARTKMSSICQLGNGYAMLYTHDGEFDEYVASDDDADNWNIKSKHDPRHWLKHLPDADLFHESFTHLACDRNGQWKVHASSPLMYNFSEWKSMRHLPVLRIEGKALTGKEWEQSKISIPELKAWQEAYES